MKCPKCADATLREIEARRGLPVDVCTSCNGIWLDKSELYPLVRRPNQLYSELVAAYKSLKSSRIPCPRCHKGMAIARIVSANLEFEVCPSCGGNWFDGTEIKKLNQALDQAAPMDVVLSRTIPEKKFEKPQKLPPIIAQRRNPIETAWMLGILLTLCALAALAAGLLLQKVIVGPSG